MDIPEEMDLAEEDDRYPLHHNKNKTSTNLKENNAVLPCIILGSFFGLLAIHSYGVHFQTVAGSKTNTYSYWQ